MGGGGGESVSCGREVGVSSGLTQIPWQMVEAVGDQSSYVSSIATYIRNTIPLIRENLSAPKKYFVNFCHKLAKYDCCVSLRVAKCQFCPSPSSAVIPAFITNLYKCKPISTIAAEQVRLPLTAQLTVLR